MKRQNSVNVTVGYIDVCVCVCSCVCVRACECVCAAVFWPFYGRGRLNELNEFPIKVMRQTEIIFGHFRVFSIICHVCHKNHINIQCWSNT